jgi:hypothetical protein
MTPTESLHLGDRDIISVRHQLLAIQYAARFTFPKRDSSEDIPFLTNNSAVQIICNAVGFSFPDDKKHPSAPGRLTVCGMDLIFAVRWFLTLSPWDSASQRDMQSDDAERHGLGEQG